MDSNPSQAKRDPLASLRIDRSLETRKIESSGFGKGWLFLLLLLLLGGSGWWFRAGLMRFAGNWIPDEVKQRSEVRLVRPTVERGRSAEAVIVASGYIESRRQAKIGARAPGRVETVNVEEGSRVKKDEILAVLEHADLDASLNATKASVARSHAALNEQQILIAQNEREWNRLESLLKTNSISVAERDTAKYQYDSAVARYESMRADVSLAEARLKEAEQLRANMFIRAPFDGTVISKDAEVGESILPGGMGEASGRGSAVTIADLDDLEIDCDVKEDYISRVLPEQAAEIAVDAVPNKRYKGLVRKVIPMGDRARATIKVKVKIVDVDKLLFPEMSATVYFLPPSDGETAVSDQPRVFVPNESVVQVNGENVVWSVDAKMHAQPIRVEVGAIRDDKTEILKGLTGSEKIVAKPNALVEGQALKVQE